MVRPWCRDVSCKSKTKLVSSRLMFYLQTLKPGDVNTGMNMLRFERGPRRKPGASSYTLTRLSLMHGLECTRLTVSLIR